MGVLNLQQWTLYLPAELVERIEEVQAVVGLIEWSPDQLVSDPEQWGKAETCPQCGKLASTIAAQLTYQKGEPWTYHFWCLGRHAWRFNSHEGRVLIGHLS